MDNEEIFNSIEGGAFSFKSDYGLQVYLKFKDSDLEDQFTDHSTDFSDFKNHIIRQCNNHLEKEYAGAKDCSSAFIAKVVADSKDQYVDLFISFRMKLNSLN